MRSNSCFLCFFSWGLGTLRLWKIIINNDESECNFKEISRPTTIIVDGREEKNRFLIEILLVLRLKSGEDGEEETNHFISR